MSIMQFTLPDPGEGLVEAEIVTWHVAAGDEVEVNQAVLEIETAKSLVELPIPWAGTVVDVLVPEGETVEVGTPIITIDVGGSAGSDDPAAPDSVTTEQEDAGVDQVADEMATAADVAPEPVSGDGTRDDSSDGADDAPSDEPKQQTLVGYGPVASSSKRRPRRGAPSFEGGGTDQVLAAPPVRLFAKQNGVDLSQVQASRADGVISQADVEAHLAGSPATGSQAASATPPAGPSGAETATAVRTTPATRPEQPSPGPATSSAGLVDERIPIKGVRKVTAQAMVSSAFTAPHVSEFLTVDMTRTMELVKELSRDREFRDVKVTPLLVVAKACLIALQREPLMNALWDDAAGEIQMRSQVNLGIAAATERGLLVPNIKDAGRYHLADLAREIANLVEIARHGKPSPAVLNGGTFSISNIGVFGVDAGTPIIKPGESGILAIGAVRPMPWVVETPDGGQEIAIRQVAQLSLSFDHRIIDGDVGSRFLSTVGRLLENPARAMAWG